MLSEFTLHTVLAATDIARAKAWYAERLGMEPLRERRGQLLYRVGGALLTIYETTSAGTAQNTVAEWHVDDLHAVMTALRARGLVFEEYDFEDFKTVDGVQAGQDGSLNAWFTDSWIAPTCGELTEIDELRSHGVRQCHSTSTRRSTKGPKTSSHRSTRIARSFAVTASGQT